jgi:CRISPR-associated protein Cas6
MTLDLLFAAHGGPLPTDHAYPLYAALAAVVPTVHDPAVAVRFAPLTGIPDGPGRLRLADFSRLRLRLPADRIPDALPLAGSVLEVAGCRVRLGVPAVVPLVPAPTLTADLVTFKHAVTPDQFLSSARRSLSELGVSGEPVLRAFRAGPRTGEPRRRIVRVKERRIVGYSLLVTGLSAADSLKLQETGLGGRTRIGCGFFLPAKEGE